MTSLKALLSLLKLFLFSPFPQGTHSTNAPQEMKTVSLLLPYFFHFPLPYRVRTIFQGIFPGKSRAAVSPTLFWSKREKWSYFSLALANGERGEGSFPSSSFPPQAINSFSSLFLPPFPFRGQKGEEEDWVTKWQIVHRDVNTCPLHKKKSYIPPLQHLRQKSATELNAVN